MSGKNTKSTSALQVHLPDEGILCIRKDAVLSVKSDYFGGRNLQCEINGIKTKASFDSVISSLRWDVTESI